MKFGATASESVSRGGNYKAVVDHYEEYDSGDYGSYYKIYYRVHDDGKDKLVGGSYKVHEMVTPRCKLWEVFTAVYGKDELLQSDKSMEDLLDKKVIVVVQNVTKGDIVFSNVIHVLPANQPPADPDAVPANW